jgi:hypothetical protein
MTETLELIKQHGVKAVLLLWLLHMNTRVNTLETALQHCYELRIEKGHAHLPSTKDKDRVLAIVPKCNLNKDEIEKLLQAHPPQMA